MQPGFQKFIKYLLIGIAVCFAVWANFRGQSSLPVSEVRAMGKHPVLGYLGAISTKNTAVNILILTTFMSAPEQGRWRRCSG